MTNYDSIWQPIAQQSWHSLFLIFGPSAPKHHRPATRSACAPASSAASNDLFTCSCAEFHQKTDTFLCVSNSIAYIELYYRIVPYWLYCRYLSVSCSFFIILLLFESFWYLFLYSPSLDKSVSHGKQLRIQKAHVRDPSLLDEGWVDAMLPHTRAPRELPLWR